MGRRTRCEVEAEKEKIFSMVQGGMTLKEVAKVLGTRENNVKMAMSRYFPYKIWREKRSKDEIAQELYYAKVIRQKVQDGLTLNEIRKSTGLSQTAIDRIRQRHNIYLGHNQRDFFIREERENEIFLQAITLADVDKFKRLVCLGEEVCVDVDVNGIPICGQVVAKYEHFALVECDKWEDSGGYPWTFLTTMNKKRIGK